MVIHLATDHAGYEHKEYIKAFLLSKGYEVFDHGNSKIDENDDYPDFISACAKAVSMDPTSKAIIFGGSGEGEAMCANRIKGVRAIVYYGGPQDILLYSRQHNDANVLSIGARFIGAPECEEAVTFWLDTAFSNDERHMKRLAKF